MRQFVCSMAYFMVDPNIMFCQYGSLLMNADHTIQIVRSSILEVMLYFRTLLNLTCSFKSCFRLKININ